VLQNFTRKIKVDWFQIFVDHFSDPGVIREKENELKLQRAEMKIIRWMCGLKVTVLV